MTRNTRVAVLSVAVAMSAACSVERAQAVTLKTGAAKVCRGQSLMLSSLPDGRFRLGQATLDSAGLAAALHKVLPAREEKLVMVRLDARNEAALLWIVPAIERSGGVGYQADSACLGASLLGRAG